MKLNISEIFYSIQGEGVTMGTPSVFLRLGGCNLLCKGEGWTCDTIAVWSKSKATDFNDVMTLDMIEQLKQGAHLVITGGEPMLHQVKVIEFLEWFYGQYDFVPFVEIETNGTIIPNISLSLMVDLWNCSPKLSNSGEPYERRVNEVALTELQRQGAIFKFVICNEGDILEVFNDFGFLNPKQFVFMPAGDTQEILNITRPLVAEQCIKLGIRYCDRLHIAIWNQKTGV